MTKPHGSRHSPFFAVGLFEVIAIVFAGLAITCKVAADHSSGSFGTNPYSVFAGVLAFMAVPFAALSATTADSRFAAAFTVAVTFAAVVVAIVVPILS
jgi:hypothetical protein